MSPEQTGLIAGGVDATSDIYALGVMLYEMLVGRLPFEPAELRAAGYTEMLRIICEVEPVRPSTRVGKLGILADPATVSRQADTKDLRQTLAGDLDWIVLKALAKDRTRRYASASELASDIDRYLNDEPVLASPPSTAYQVRKWMGIAIRRDDDFFALWRPDPATRRSGSWRTLSPRPSGGPRATSGITQSSTRVDQRCSG